jgi:cellulose synthase/poly-beta-1,6-N-acetylglucosamine synthase-like glycosyltransferase
MKPTRSWLLPAAVTVAAVLACGAILIASRAAAASFNVFIYLAANLIVFLDMLDFGLRLHLRRMGRGPDVSGASDEMSVALGIQGITPYQKRLHLRPYALIASIHNTGDHLDNFLEAMEPYRDHLWVVDDASTDDTVIRVRQAGWRCLDGIQNRKKPGAIRRLLATLPPEVETVMVLDPDIAIRDTKDKELSHLEAIIFDFQRSGMAAMCPRIAIKKDGLLARFQSLEYGMAFVVGRCSLADHSITSGIAVYRRNALEFALAKHSLSVYAEDLENSVILLGAGERIYYDGRLVIETEGVANVRRWFSQRVGWSYGLIKIYVEHFAEIWGVGRKGFIGGYQFLVYLGVFSLAFQPLKILSFGLLVLSFLGGLGSFFGFEVVPDLTAANPIYFLAAYAKYLLLSLVAFCIVVPREQRLHVLPIVPLYFFYALLQIVPISVGYANWLSLRLGGRRLFKDHYQDEESLTRQDYLPGAAEKA